MAKQIEAPLLANAIRALSMDAVEKAKSGHPGMPMGMADVATILFRDFLKFDPKNPNWPNRDRFILSAGHGSMLLYSLLYLTGYKDMTLDQIKNFRMLGSITAGHPEYGHAGGIETTTGPLGQGLANAVGFALGEEILRSVFGQNVMDHFTYVIAGDGCLMEGISQEAISLAGHLKLAKLILLFDDNQISIDGPTDLATSDDQAARFVASGWHVQKIDGHNHDEIAAAIRIAQESDKPSMIACRTIIGYGAPNKQGSAGVHGSPLGADEIAAARAKLEWPHAPFEIPDDILSAWRAIGAAGGAEFQNWQASYQKLPADLRQEFDRRLRGDLPATLAKVILDLKKTFAGDPQKIATRQSSGMVIEKLVDLLPELIGGSADLTGSNLTKAKKAVPMAPQKFTGNYIYYGVREHGMAAVMNGMSLHGGIIPFGGTFLVFTDYCRPAIRLAALMQQGVIYVMTHDSIGLGEDGPTHQPVEHLAALRAIPNLLVMRPADAIEVAECWEIALRHRQTPSLLALSRQGLPLLRAADEENLSARGAYIVKGDVKGASHALIATGSEVHLAVAAQEKLSGEGISSYVVSMPCRELFESQDEKYQQQILPEKTKRVVIEAASSFGWDSYLGKDGVFIGMKGFGASAPASDLYAHFGITVEAICDAVKK